MRYLVLTLISGALVAASAVSASAQTLQLPTFETFSTNSSVLVPDRGTATMGGITRSANGSVQFGGLPGNRASGGSTSAGGLQVTAQIHDMAELDDQVLRRAAVQRNKQSGINVAAGRPPVAGERLTTVNTDGPAAPLGSVAELVARRAAGQKAAQPLADTSALLGKARQAIAAGKPKLAEVYLRQAAHDASEAAASEIALVQAELRGAQRSSAPAASTQTAASSAAPRRSSQVAKSVGR